MLMKKYIRLLSVVLFVSAWSFPSFSQQINYRINKNTGAISSLKIQNDNRQMNWILETNNSQYEWVGEEYGWGLGNFYQVSGSDTTVQEWKIPVKVENSKYEYRIGAIHISVNRVTKGNDLIEEYTFENIGNDTQKVIDIGINTPFNDNYPDATICMKARTNAHVWCGKNTAYVNAMHMSNRAPHLGLVVINGAIKGYEVKERGLNKGGSNFRGVIILKPENITLKPHQKYTLSWRLFSHQGWPDFFSKVLDAGCVVGESDKYVYEKGQTANLRFESRHPLENPLLYFDDSVINLNSKGTVYTASVGIERTGEYLFELIYDGGKKTNIEILGISTEKDLLAKRANFIINHQQLKDSTDLRYGAYMVFDNELDEIFLNNKPSVNPVDRDEGAERLGMGIFLATYYLQTGNPKIKESLLKYAAFVRKLQNKEYRVWSSIDHKQRNRAYNYPWVTTFYLKMFEVTGDKQFLIDAYGTMKSMFKQFGYGFYAIDMPVQLSQNLLRTNGMKDKADSLLKDFKKVGDTYLKNGLDYPSHEVNFEQTIVCPAITTLLQLYQVTGEKKYLEGAELQLPVLESFLGKQPSFHLNEISIRHWDGYWFGKREFWGDTMPHYWSTQTAEAFNLYAKCSGNLFYRKRAENIVRNNLCLFSEEGRGHCVYLYPDKVNGVKAQFYDPFSNDQDWALVYYLRIFNI